MKRWVPKAAVPAYRPGAAVRVQTNDPYDVRPKGGNARPAPPPAPPPPHDEHDPFPDPSPPSTSPSPKRHKRHERPERPKRSVCSLPALPASLHELGNRKAWWKVHSHILSRPHDPLVVWGPTGCGKSRGAEELLQAMGFRLVTVDGADAENAHELCRWVSDARRSKCADGPMAVLLDDWEGFTDLSRQLVSQKLEQRSREEEHFSLNPLLITCTQARDPEMHRTLSPFAQVRLFAPSAKVMVDFFSKGVRFLRMDGVQEHVPVRAAWLQGEAMYSGDLRRVRLELIDRHLNGGAQREAAHSHFFSNSFEATRKLLLRVATAEEWADQAEERDVDLLAEHAPQHVEDEHSASLLLQYLSDAACMRPAHRVESTQHPLLVAGMAALSVSQAKVVGALPPRRVPRVVPLSSAAVDALRLQGGGGSECGRAAPSSCGKAHV